MKLQHCSFNMYSKPLALSERNFPGGVEGENQWKHFSDKQLLDDCFVIQQQCRRRNNSYRRGQNSNMRGSVSREAVYVQFHQKKHISPSPSPRQQLQLPSLPPFSWSKEYLGNPSYVGFSPHLGNVLFASSWNHAPENHCVSIAVLFLGAFLSHGTRFPQEIITQRNLFVCNCMWLVDCLTWVHRYHSFDALMPPFPFSGKKKSVVSW